MNSITRSSIALSLAVTFAAVTGASADDSISCSADSYQPRSLSGAADTPLPESPLFRFAQLSDVHIYDDDGSPVFNGSQLEPALEPTIANGSAQRLQDEFTDEVLNAMIRTVNVCNAKNPLALMIATGDNTDTMTLNETRRYIDNLDGVSGKATLVEAANGTAGVTTAFEKNCAYTTVDSRGEPKLGGTLPCTPEMQQLATLATGKLVADSQANTPDPDSPIDQFMPTRSPRQIASTVASSALGLSYSIAPGLPEELRCNDGEADCTNHALAVPYYAVFGNHDGAVRGTVTMQRPFQAGTLAHGRYFFQSQREWINEFFFTTATPGPIGHGFAQVESDRFNDPDDRNDGYYAFDVADGKIRMIVLNTLYDGVLTDLHRQGQTNADSQGLVQGSEATNPIGLEQGVMPQEQYDWLSAELDASGDKAVLIFSHHPDRSFTERRLGFAAEGVTSDQLDNLLGEHANVVAHIAGHTHENIIRACKPGPGGCPIGDGTTLQPDVANGFWRIETASLIDYPQEARIVEVYDLCEDEANQNEDEGCTLAAGERYALRLTMISPDPNDPAAALSHRLSIAEATCNVSQMLGGSMSSGPYDQARLETVIDNAGEAAVQQKFCFGEASLSLAEGSSGDRDVILLP